MMCGGKEEHHVHGSGGSGRCCGHGAGEPFAIKGVKSNNRKRGGSFEKRMRDYFVRTNIDVIAVGLILAWYHARVVDASSEVGAEEGGASEGDDGHTEEEIYGKEEKDTYALLFPWFAQIIGVFAYYFLSRFAHAIPYTAIMFLIGAAIGFSVQRTDGKDESAITFSASTWLGVEGEVILLVFLPGLLYLDSYNIDVHLFLASFWQLITFAFPMVLAGTTLTALVAYYIFPYGWSFDLCMTFGSILAATDPVAVAVLLNELGAPPRLKMHVSGESLMNDGSAVVFYHIFSLRFLFELGLSGVGSDIGWAEGFTLFFRLSLGGACIGIAFGVGLLIILYNLNRRLSGEDSVVQVVSTVTTAYLAFFTSEILAQCSGIIAVVFCGVTVKAFGETLYNDSHLSHHFWECLESLLNTLLFTLGGCVWGDLISHKVDNTTEGNVKGLFEGADWGYLLILFVLITIIRFFLVFAFYPITSRIGIGSDWREAVFMSYSGLRGAVGIALALSLHAEIEHATSAKTFPDETELQFRMYTAKLFGMVGGIALLTLVVNGPTCGPLLKRLGLVTPTETRKKVIENYYQNMVKFTLREYIALLTQKRFQDVDFSVVREHVPFLKDTNYEQLVAAVRKHKETTPAFLYEKPDLKNVIPYIYHPEDINVETGNDDTKPPSPRPLRRAQFATSRRDSVRNIRESCGNRHTVFDLRVRYDKRVVQEERLVFVKILRSSYFRQVEHGELQQRGFLFHSLEKSLDYAEDAASRGLPLEDWNALEVASDSFARPAAHIVKKLFKLQQRVKHRKFRINFDLDFFVVSLRIRQTLSFIHAHQWARKLFKNEFSKGGENSLTAPEKIVLDESDHQVEMANNFLSSLDEIDVAIVKSHYVCQILLNRAAYYFSKLRKHGLMTEREAGEFLEEIEENIYDVYECSEVNHVDELAEHHKVTRMSSLPQRFLMSFDLLDSSKKKLSVIDNENPPQEEEALRSIHLSESEKKDLGLDGSVVKISDNEVEALRNSEVM